MDLRLLRGFPFRPDGLEWTECCFRHPPRPKIGPARDPAGNSDSHTQSCNDYALSFSLPNSRTVHSDPFGHCQPILLPLSNGTGPCFDVDHDRWDRRMALVAIFTQALALSP